MQQLTLDTLVTIERKVVTQDATYGTEDIAWQSIVMQLGSPSVPQKLWAEVRDALPSRSESVQQGLAVARNQTRIRMRYRSDVDSTMRITVHRDTDVVYQIIGGPSEIGRREGIEMVVERYSTEVT